MRRLTTTLTMAFVFFVTMAPTPIYMSINDTGFSSRAEIKEPEDFLARAQEKRFRNRRGHLWLRIQANEPLYADLERAHRTGRKIRKVALRSERGGQRTRYAYELMNVTVKGYLPAQGEFDLQYDTVKFYFYEIND